MIAFLAAAVLLLPPPNFYEAKALEPAASFVAGKPAVIYCSNTFGDWVRYSLDNGTPGAVGLTPLGGSQSELESPVCDVLLKHLSRRAVTVYDLAASVRILVHEAIHQRGVTDEAQTECVAMHEMPRVAVKFFRIKAGRQLRALMAQAWVSHRKTPPQFQTVC